MKNLTFLTLLFLGSQLVAQPIIQSSKDTVCTGQSVNLTLTPPAYELASGQTGTNNHNGYMFDVVASYDAIIYGFEISPVSSGATYYVYYRTGTHVNFENSATGWTLLDSVTNVPSGTDINPGFDFQQPIVAGQTLAFYITSNGTNYTYYTNGTSVGNTLASDAFLTLKEGVGKAYPFANTYSVRNMNGKILYYPAMTQVKWSSGQTTNSISTIVNRSMMVGANATLSNNTTLDAKPKAIIAKDLDIVLQANPPNVIPGQSTKITALTTLNRGALTQSDGTNSQNGAMFDLSATSGLEISGFTVSTTDTQSADIEIMYKPGTHVGFETNQNAWTSLETYQGLNGGIGVYLPLSNNLQMVPGQTLAFYITRTDGGRIHYDNGTMVGDKAGSAGNLMIKQGVGKVYPFGTTYSPRVLNMLVHFSDTLLNNLVFKWSNGATSKSILVFPPYTRKYSLNSIIDSCIHIAEVTVTVGWMGLEDANLNRISAYPNPVNDHLTLSIPTEAGSYNIELVDLTGRRILNTRTNQGEPHYEINTEAIKPGFYMLRVSQNSKQKIFKIEKR